MVDLAGRSGPAGCCPILSVPNEWYGMVANKLPDPLRAEIEAFIERHARRTRSVRTPVPGLSVARITAPIPPTTHLDASCLCVCVRGKRRLTIGDERVVHHENRFLLTAIEVPTIIAIPDASPAHPYTGLRIDLDLDAAREIIAELELERAPIPDTTFTTAALDPDLLDCVYRLVRLIERPSEIPFMARHLHREIVYRLLASPSGGRLRQLVRLDSETQSATKAVAWLRAHYRERLGVDVLARKAGMGVSTLHRHFRELTSMSPIQYQKHLRLHAARRLMLEDQVDVTAAAFGVGYESPTQFSREYRRLFGRPPRRDVVALRAAGGERRV